MPPRVGRGGAGDAGVVDDVGIAQMRALIEVRLSSPVYPSLARGAPSLRPTRPPDAHVGTPVALRRPTSATATRSARPFARSTTRGRPSTTVSATSSPRRGAPFARFVEQLARLRDLLRRARAPRRPSPPTSSRVDGRSASPSRAASLAVAAYLNDAANAREAVETRAHLHRVDRDNAARLADDHRRRVDETVALSSAMANVESKLLRWRANVAEGLRVAARTAAPRARIRIRTRTDAGRDPKTTAPKARPSGKRPKAGTVSARTSETSRAGNWRRRRTRRSHESSTRNARRRRRAKPSSRGRRRRRRGRHARDAGRFLAEAREKAFASRGGSVDWSADPRGARDEPPLEPPLDILEANGVNRVARALEAARAMVEGGEGFRGNDSERAEGAEAERRRQSRKRRETRGGLLVMEEDDERDEDGGDERRRRTGDGTRVESRHQSRDGVERRRVSSSGTSGASSSAAFRGRRRDDRRSVVDWIEDEDEERGDLLESSLRAELGTGTGTGGGPASGGAE